MESRAVQQLPDEPVDIVGDVHGHLEPLKRLLGLLGYDSAYRHPEGRRLVFLGDLCDRGPDSPGVFDLVMEASQSGGAVCLLGNHELALVEGKPKSGNAWFFGNQKARDNDRKEYGAFRRVSASARKDIIAFCESMPLAIEHPTVQIVHACWHQPSLEFLGSLEPTSNSTRMNICEKEVSRMLDREGLLSRLAHARRRLAGSLRRNSWKANGQLSREVRCLVDDLVRGELIAQNQNPLKVVTSGRERRAKQAAWISGKWRFHERIPWWRTAKLWRPTVFGHYWRQRDFVQPQDRDQHSVLFGPAGPQEWLGREKHAMCIDFRWSASPGQSALAAYRPDLHEIVFWDGKFRSEWGRNRRRSAG